MVGADCFPPAPMPPASILLAFAATLLLVAFVALAAIAVVAVALILLQGRLLFGRTWHLRRAPGGPSADRRETHAVTLRRDGVRLEGWLTRAKTEPPRRLLLWFGGRNEQVAWTRDLGGWLPDDCALLAFNYRGLGGSTGWPSERACVADALAMAEWGLAHLGLGPEALHVAGRSIGSGIAMQMAARLASARQLPRGLVLITPPMSLRAVLAAMPWVRPLVGLLRSPLDSVAAAAVLPCPALVLLAEHDHRVPYAHSMALVDALRETGAAVEVHRLAGTNHRNLVRRPEAMGLVGRWLAELA